jgi:hypothetical protein
MNLEMAAAPATVYGLYTDAARLADWQDGIKDVSVTGPLDRVGSEVTIRYGWPFTVKGIVLAADAGVRHQERLKEMLGLVTCTTTATFVPGGSGTTATFDFDYHVAGGPIGRLFDGMVGGEIVGRFGKDSAKLKTLAERQSGPG